ncbi:hypothetical protein Golomagni_00502 [Golovinomyces magnicellulatus]|nr:hypothetical protein Golomagni_00502 [Golovinomyces magnicellulatus]
MDTELARAVQEEAQQLWTNESIQIQLNKYQNFNSRFNPRNLNTNSSENIQTKPETMKQETSVFSTQKQQFPQHPLFESLLQASQSSASREMPYYNNTECFENLPRDLQRLQRGLSHEYRMDGTLRDKLLNAYHDIKECAHACFKPASSSQALAAEIRTSIATASRIKQREQKPPLMTAII